MDEIPQPFKDYHDLHAWRRVNCEGCERWSCFFHCPIWESMSDSVRSKEPIPIPQETLIAAGCTGDPIWPCKGFKDYGYIGFVAGAGRRK